jgi:site-specific DNA-cytosine methylase
MIGNAVPVKLAEFVASGIVEYSKIKSSTIK